MSKKGKSSSSNSRACAACKHQRRKCYQGCILARYFPAERAAQFEAVHRFFGVSNLMRFYNAASSEQQRDHVVATLTFEAEARRNSPVLGCVAIIHDLSARISATHSELEATFSQLDFYRRQQQIQMQQLLLAARQQQQQQMMMMMMMPPPPLAPVLDLHANSLLQQQQVPLPPPLPPLVLMNLDDEEVDIGRLKEDERSGKSHGSQPSDELAIRSFNPAAALPNLVVDQRSHIPGSSSNQVGLDELCGIQGWSAREPELDGLTVETGDLFYS